MSRKFHNYAAWIITPRFFLFTFCSVLTFSVITMGLTSLLAGRQNQSAPSIATPSVLQDGDILLLHTSTLRGQIVLHAADTRKFTHAGIVHLHDGISHLIHADPESVVRNEPLDAVFRRSGVKAFAVLRYPNVVSAHMAAEWALRHAEQATRFDQQFRNSTPDSLYCTELIWRAFQSAGVDLLQDVANPLSKLPLLQEPILLPNTLARSKILISPVRLFESQTPVLTPLRHDHSTHPNPALSLIIPTTNHPNNP